MINIYISMKKISIVLFISLLGVILIMSKDTNKTVVNVLASFTINVLPTLAPALLINNLISFSGGISELLSKSKNSYHINIIYLIITGLISGTPALATQVNNETNKSISLNDAQLILECFSFPSLPFIIALVNISDWHKKYLYLAILTPLILSILYFLYKYKQNNHLIDTSYTYKNTDNVLAKAILVTFKSIVLMSGSIMLFSLFLIPLSSLIPSPYIYYVQGILEFSYPLTYLFCNFTKLNCLLVTFIISFSSISLVMQIHLLAKEINIISIIKKRLILAALSTLFTLIFLF